MCYKGKKYKESWTGKRRLTQSERCKAQNPSNHAKGPKTCIGKAISSQNARTHGIRSKEVLILLSLLSEQNRYLKELLIDVDNARYGHCEE